eukprot:gene11015-11170_t
MAACGLLLQHLPTGNPNVQLNTGDISSIVLEFGLSDEEVAACDLACSISIGRLQESLSLSHAVSIVLAQFYQARLSSVAAAAAVPTAALPYTVQHISQLAAGYDSTSGIEH